MSGNSNAGKKKGGGFLARQAQKKKSITEEELLTKDVIRPEDVTKLGKMTESKVTNITAYKTIYTNTFLPVTDKLSVIIIHCPSLTIYQLLLK